MKLSPEELMELKLSKGCFIATHKWDRRIPDENFSLFLIHNLHQLIELKLAYIKIYTTINPQVNLYVIIGTKTITSMSTSDIMKLPEPTRTRLIAVLEESNETNN